MISFMRRYGLAVLGGVLLAAAFPRFHVHFLAWFALVPLMIQSLYSGPRLALRQWLLAGWVFHSLVLQWLAVNQFWAGGWAVIGYQMLVMALTVFWGALGFFWVYACNKRSPVEGALLFALLWCGMEWCHANLFTGFGWCNLGYSQGPNAYLLQWAALGGVAVIAFWLALVNALIALAVVYHRWRWHRLAAAAVALLLSHGAGYLLLGEADYESRVWRVGQYQSNYSQEFKWDREFYQPQIDLAAYYCEQLSKYHPEKIDGFVWPEGLIMDHYEDPGMMAAMRELTVGTGAWLFAGTGRRGEGGFYNSSIVVDAEGNVTGHYDKVHLAPYGEYIPFQEYLPFLQSIVPGGGVAPGAEQKVLEAGGRKLGPLICFEVLFGPMSQELRRLGADALVVVTNLAWFGRSNAIPQELELARVRAVETRLPLIHCSNTGYTGVFDPYGRFQHIDSAMYNGNFVSLDLEKYRLEWLLGRRMVGALPVAAPGALLWSGGPESVPALLLLAGLIAGALVLLLSPLREDGADGTGDGEGEAPNDESEGPVKPPSRSLRGVRIDGEH